MHHTDICIFSQLSSGRVYLSLSLPGSWKLVGGPYWIYGWPRPRRTKFHLLLWRYYRCVQHSPPDVNYITASLPGCCMDMYQVFPLLHAWVPCCMQLGFPSIMYLALVCTSTKARYITAHGKFLLGFSYFCTVNSGSIRYWIVNRYVYTSTHDLEWWFSMFHVASHYCIVHVGTINEPHLPKEIGLYVMSSHPLCVQDMFRPIPGLMVRILALPLCSDLLHSWLTFLPVA